jgi:hypothetical protein
MKPALAILTTTLLLASQATAQPAPAGPPPTFKVVSGTDKTKGLIEFIETTTRLVPERREVLKEIAVVIDGRQVKQVVTEVVMVHVPVTVQSKVVIDAAKARVITPDGKQLPIDEVWKRLKQDTVHAGAGVSEGAESGDAGHHRAAAARHDGAARAATAAEG